MAVTLAACGADPSPKTPPETRSSDVKTIELTKLDPSDQLPDGTNPMTWFGERIFPLVNQYAAGTTNPVYSPLSVYMALAMVADGARGSTADQFAQVLAGDRDTVNQTAAALLKDYSTFDKKTPLQSIVKVADSIWADDGINLKEAFREDMTNFYRSDAYNVDFSKPDSADQVNQWVSEKTEKLIDKILNQEDTDSLLLYLVNALYFKGSWTYRASPDDTAEADFTLPDGQTVKADMMTFGWGPASYLKLDDGSEGALLSYGDGRFAMAAVMPAEGIDSMEWDGTRLAGWLDKAQPKHHGNITVKLPKWEADSGQMDLIPVLKAAGLTDVFDEINADLSGLAEPSDGLFVDLVSHRAVIKVNEEGTEAAAATGVGVAESAAINEEPVTVEFNRPFVYSIVDTSTGLPLFLGIVNNPTA
jgi:serpin B